MPGYGLIPLAGCRLVPRSVQKYDCRDSISANSRKKARFTGIPVLSILATRGFKLGERFLAGFKTTAWTVLSGTSSRRRHFRDFKLLAGNNNSVVHPIAGGIAPVPLFHELS